MKNELAPLKKWAKSEEFSVFGTSTLGPSRVVPLVEEILATCLVKSHNEVNWMTPNLHPSSLLLLPLTHDRLLANAR